MSTENAIESPLPRPGFFKSIYFLVGRSLFPITAVIILGGTLLWGPWVSLAIAVTWFGLVNIVG